jgi:hypothetical protein
LLWQNITDWVLYKEKIRLAHTMEAEHSRLNDPISLASGEILAINTWKICRWDHTVGEQWAFSRGTPGQCQDRLHQPSLVNTSLLLAEVEYYQTVLIPPTGSPPNNLSTSHWTHHLPTLPHQGPSSMNLAYCLGNCWSAWLSTILWPCAVKIGTWVFSGDLLRIAG